MSASRRRRRVGRAPHRRCDWPVVAAALTLWVSCAADRPWDQSAEKLLSELAVGNHAVLFGIDFAAYPSAHALALGQDAPLYLAKILLREGRAEDARRLLELQTRRGPNWARTRTLVLLAQLRIDLGQYRQAAAAARRAIASGGAADLTAAGERLLTNALYRQRKDEEVLGRLGDATLAGEELLIRAVARHRTGRIGWDADLLWLAQAEPSSGLHERAWAYLTIGPARGAPGSALPPADLNALRTLMEAKSHLAGGNRPDAVTAFEEALEACPALISPLIAEEMGGAYRWLGAATRGTGRFRALVQRPGAGVGMGDELDAVDAAIGEQLARLARDAGDYPAAVRALLRLQESATSVAAHDRYTWLLLDIYLNRAPALRPAGLSPLVQSAAAWGDPAYFADLHAQHVSRSVAARDWAEIAVLRAALAERGDAPQLVAQASYVLARASDAGLTSGKATTGHSPTELLREAAALDPAGYYGRLAALWLQNDPAGSATTAPLTPPPTGDGDTEDVGSGDDMDRFVAGLFRYGLFEEGMLTISGADPPLSTWVLRQASIALAQVGLLRESIGVASRVLARPAAEQRPGDRERGYPRHFSAQVDLLDLGGVPQPVFYGLVREESRFDADIVSSAGAIGLTQLMPDTAADEARRMRLTEPLELTDAERNLRIGAAHLARLYGRLDGSIARSLMAYNAGLSRVRRWDRAFEGFPLDLYVEALPFAETRGYVRKILTSTHHYAAIYWEMTEREAASLFYDLAGTDSRNGDER